MQLNEIINYTNYVFNLFNGKVNDVIEASLKIEADDIFQSVAFDGASPIMGAAQFNRVVIYPLNIFTFEYAKTEDDFKLLITELVIHELSHVNQLRDNSVPIILSEDWVKNYSLLQESSNQINTMQWIKKVIESKDICEKLGINLDNITPELYIAFASYVYIEDAIYVKTNLYQYYRDLVGLLCDYSIFISNSLLELPNIELSIIDENHNTHNKYVIKKDGIFNPNVTPLSNYIIDFIFAGFRLDYSFWFGEAMTGKDSMEYIIKLTLNERTILDIG